MELTEDSVKEFIKEGKVIIKAWGDGCGFCTEYAPTFEKYASEHPDIKFGSIKINLKEPSAFKRAYMKSEKGAEKNSIPATFIFQDGELKNAAWGRLSEDQLKSFVEAGVSPNQKPMTIEEYAIKASVVEIKASIYDEMVKIENAQKIIQFLNAELIRRQPQKAL